MNNLYRKWSAASWTRPVLTVVLTLLPMWLVLGAVSIVFPKMAVWVWAFVAASVFERVRPIRRLIRVRRYRAWLRKQHRGPERVYAAGCVCPDCVKTRKDEPFNTELFDESIKIGAITLTRTRVDSELTRTMSCGNCAAGSGMGNPCPIHDGENT